MKKQLNASALAEPILEDIVNIVNTFQKKNYGQLIPKILEVVEHIKEIFNNCISQKATNINLQLDPFTIIALISAGVKIVGEIITWFK